MNGSDIAQLKKLYELSFDDSPEYVDYFFRKKTDPDRVVFRRWNGKIVSALHLIEKPFSLRGAEFRCPFIVAAATLPELRGKRILEGVMAEAFRRIDREGDCFTVLYPFSHTYYLKYGFATYTGREEKILDGTGTRKVDAVLCGRESAEIFAEIYRKFSKGKTGFVLRNAVWFEKQWDEWNADGNKTYLLYSKDLPVAYLAIGKSGVAEYCGDLEYLNSLSLKGLKVELPCGTKEGDQVRIVNPQRLMEKISYDGDGIVEFFLKDDFYPENTGGYVLVVENGKGKLHRTEPNGKTVIDIAAFAQIVFGYREKEEFSQVLKKKDTFCFDKF